MLNSASRANRLVARTTLLLALLTPGLAAQPGFGQLAEQARADTGALRQSAADTGGARRYHAGPLPPQSAFAVSQLRYERVLNARVEARYDVKRLFRERGLRYPAEQIFMRIFKRERQLELWVKPSGGEEFALLKTYGICALAGELGPKRRQGDEQVPEGFYYVDFFNPQSDYHLSLHLDYPNRSDALLGDTVDLGGDIFIHGGCNSAGCLALTDQGIKEVYWLSVEARGAGQGRIPVHIFPARLSDGEMPLLGKAFQSAPRLLSFWKNLKTGYDYFERERRVPRMSVAANGSYQLAGEERFEPAAGEPSPGPAGPRPLGTPVNLGTPSALGVQATSSPAAPAETSGDLPAASSGAAVQPLGSTLPGPAAPAVGAPASGATTVPRPLGAPLPGPAAPPAATAPASGATTTPQPLGTPLPGPAVPTAGAPADTAATLPRPLGTPLPATPPAREPGGN